MTVKSLTGLKGQFDQTDPHDHNVDMVDSMSGLAYGMKLLSFDGRNGAGAITVTGAAVGDAIVYVAGLTAGSLGNASALFETTVSVVDQIQQVSATDVSTKDYIALLAPVVS